MILYMWYTVLEDNSPWSLMFLNNGCLCQWHCFQECLWCFLTVVLTMTLESPLYSKEIKPINPKGNQPWIFIGRTDAKAEAPILWLPDGKSQFMGKDPDAGKDWGQEKKGAIENEVVEWCHRLNGHELEQTPGDGKDGEGWDATVLGVTKSWTQLSN